MHPIARCIAAARCEIAEEDAFDDKDHMRALENYLGRRGYGLGDLEIDWLAASVLREIDELKTYCEVTGSLLSELRASNMDAEAALAGLPCPRSVEGRHDIRAVVFRPRNF